MQLEECSVSREMILRYVSKTVRSILRKVLLMEVVPTAIKQELESQKLLEQGLGLELDTRSCHQRIFLFFAPVGALSLFLIFPLPKIREKYWRELEYGHTTSQGK